ncbi:MAG: tetratricopeptide repeat protein [Gammaproteobacteria bacterium]|nr:tetratricopeptide repeat protein [Gammaproteobacteria bacterium]
MFQSNILFRLLFIIVISVSFTGCASMSQWAKGKDSDYDFFLENKDGTKVDTKEASIASETKGAKEARMKATVALQQGDLDTALIYYVKALEHDDKDVEALNGIANIHFERGNNDLAILAYRMTLAEYPDNLDAKQGLGLSLVKANKYEEARFVLLNALADNPQRARIYNGLGVISDIQRYYEEARWFYARGLMIEENSPVLMTNLGYSYYLENKWDNAEKIYYKVLESHPNHIQAQLNLGLLKARQGELYDALSAFQKVLTEPQAYNELGYIMMLDNKYTMAEQLFNKAISASPSYFEKAHDNLEKLKELKAKRESPFKTSTLLQ